MQGRVIVALTLHDLRARYAGSWLGALWAVVSPMITILIYWFVYTVALKNTTSGVSYVLWLICGILPWFFFADGLNGAATVFLDYRFWVQKLRFPSGVLPLIRVFSAFWVHGLLLLIAYAILCITGIDPKIGQLWILFWMICGLFWVFALGRILALWCTYVRDVAYGLQAALSLGFWVTPIFWDASELGGVLFTLCRYNPASILADGYREALLGGGLLSLDRTLVFVATALLLWALGEIGMRKLGPTLADRL